MLQVDSKKEDISMAYRLLVYSGKHQYPPIIVQFYSRKVKENWTLAVKKMITLDVGEIGASMPLLQSFY